MLFKCCQGLKMLGAWLSKNTNPRSALTREKNADGGHALDWLKVTQNTALPNYSWKEREGEDERNREKERHREGERKTEKLGRVLCLLMIFITADLFMRHIECPSSSVQCNCN